MNEPATASSALDDAQRVLERRARAFRFKVEQAARTFAEDLIVARAGRMDDLIDDWHANLHAQIDYLHHFASSATDVPASSECARVQRDLFRWSRKIAARASARLRVKYATDLIHHPSQLVLEAAGSLQTVTVRLEPELFEGEQGDGFWIGLRKGRARKRAERQDATRVVAMGRLAEQLVVPRWLDAVENWIHRIGALQVAFWTKTRAHVDEVGDMLRALGRRLEVDDPVDWDAFRREIDGAVGQWRDELTGFADDLEERVQRETREILDDYEDVLERSGTFLVNERRYDAEEAEQLIQRSRSRLVDVSHDWTELGEATLARAELHIEGRGYVAAVRYIHDRDSARIRTHLRRHVLEPLEALRVKLTAARETLASTIDVESPDPECLARVQTEHAQLMDAVRGKCLTALTRDETRHQLDRIGSEMEESLHSSIRKLSSGYEVPTSRIDVREGRPAPSYETVRIPLQRKGDELVAEHVLRAGQRARRDSVALFDELRRSLEDVRRLVDYNLNAAEEHIDAQAEDQDALETFAIHGLEVASERVQELQETAASRIEEILDRLRNETRDRLADFETFLKRAGAGTTATSVARSNTVAMPAMARPASAAERGPDETRAAAPPGGERAPDHHDHEQDRGPGLQVARTADLHRVSTVLRELTVMPGIRERLPESYIRYFDGAHHGESTRRAVESHLKRFEDTLDRWQNGDPESVAVVGIRGSGRGSVVAGIVDELDGRYPLLRVQVGERAHHPQQLRELLARLFHLPEPLSLGELTTRLQERPERVAVVLEFAERLFLRHPAGLRSIRELLTLITTTSDKVLWVVTFEQTAFDFLQFVLSLSDAFTDIHRLEAMEYDEFVERMRAQHGLSGRPLAFLERPDGLPPEDTFFTELYVASRAYFPLAQVLWLRSAQVMDGRGTIGLSQVETPGKSIMRPLSAIKSASLGAFMLHSGLTRAHFAEVMRIPSDEAASLLAQLRHLHLVEPSHRVEGEFVIAPSVHQLVYAELVGRNVF